MYDWRKIRLFLAALHGLSTLMRINLKSRCTNDENLPKSAGDDPANVDYFDRIS